VPINLNKPPQWILDIAKKLDTPQMMRLYREQKANDKTLDKRVEEFTEENQDLFDHLKPPGAEK